MKIRIGRVVAPALTPVLALLLGACAAPALADDDGPDPGVARISVLRGDVEIRRGDDGDAVAAAVNAPLMAGDYLSTHEDARAEVQFDYGNALRAGADSELRFTSIDTSNHAVQLAQGTVELRVSRLTDARPEIDTPSAVVRPAEVGRYRVTVTDDGDTLVTVRSGRVDIVSPQSVRSVDAGNTELVQGSASNPSFRQVNAVASDDFDRWNDERDQYLERVRSSEYVSEGLVGAEDLDRYGHWVDVSGYGNVWAPYAATGWAPYQSGRWVWQGYYGWTWVSYEPWGWAPYHYGRWFYDRGYGWCWYPEREIARPAWRPALVAFFSFGGGGGVNVGFGNVGWVPLGPREPFHPWWGRRYINNRTTIVNNTTITNINIYRNVGAPGGANGISHHDFAGGRFDRTVRVSPVEMRSAKPVRGVLPVVPTTENLRPSDRPVVRRDRARPVEQRFTRFPSPSTPVRSFNDQRGDVQAAAQRQYPRHADEILRESQAPVLRSTVPVGRPTENVDAKTPPAWRRFDGERGRTVRPATPSTTGPAAVQTAPGPIQGTPATFPRRRIDAPNQGTAAPETSRPWDRFKPGGPAPTPPERRSDAPPSGRPSGMHSGPERFPRRQVETAPPPATRSETAPPPASRTEIAPPPAMRSETALPPAMRSETVRPPAARTETARPPVLRTETARPAAAPARIWRSPGGRGDVTRPERVRGSSSPAPSPAATTRGARRHLDGAPRAEGEDRASSRARE